ncbi:MAG: flagellar biosynthesis protein FlgD [Xanthobacteraceae bacterium]|nr:MAG: flagellar biosynthesis protein FlgD [Xanthobacteraceae bacterium]
MTTTASVASALTSATSASSTSSSSSTSTSKDTLAGNFQTFLTLLTTQLQNQNPLDPLDTNQFTQQLVQFAQVEQQLKQSDQLGALLELQKSTQATQALNYVGFSAAVDGATTQLASGSATWSMTAPKPVSAAVTITNAAGQTAYSGNFSLTSGVNNFVWDGKGNDGAQWPDGSYTVSITAKDASGQSTAVSTEIVGTVEAADLTQSPPKLTINGAAYDLSQIKRVVRPGTTI